MISSIVNKGLLASFILGTSYFETAFSYKSEKEFSEYIRQYHYPQMFDDNNKALEARINLLENAPKGAEIKVLTFVFDNGDATRKQLM